MVSYQEVKASNNRIATELPSGLVAVFVGATNGIGEYTLKEFARFTKQPKVYFIGRSQEAGSRIEAECSKLNPEGKFTFIKADTSLVKNVDEVCKDLKTKEKVINLLVLSTGTLDFYTSTPEDLRLAAALIHYCRLRFIQNLLPEIQASTSLRRVVSVFAGSKEGPFSSDDINGDKISLAQKRGHAASLVTLGMESLAKTAPNVSFIHDFPGPVKSGIARDMPGVVGYIVRFLGMVLGPFFNIANEESGAYHLYFATSARYPPKEVSGVSVGVPYGKDLSVAKGNTGTTGSGMYCIDERGESAKPSVEQQLADLRKAGAVEAVWENVKGEWERIVGK